MGCGGGLEESSAVLFVSSFRHLTSSLTSHVSRETSECRKSRGCSPETMKREKGILRSEYQERGKQIKSWILHHHPLDMFLHTSGDYGELVHPNALSEDACTVDSDQFFSNSPKIAVPPLPCGIVLLIWSCMGYILRSGAGYPPSPSRTSQPGRQLSHAKHHEKWVDLGLR